MRLLEPSTGDGLARFLIARWGAYHRAGPLLLFTPVEHRPWPLRGPEVETCRVAGLFRAGGLPQPTGPPIARFSPGVGVRVGTPQLVR